MNKLKLQLEDLRIDSFTTTPVQKERGTVFGEQCTCYTACTCPGCPSCDASCGGTCAASCNGTCAGSCNGTCDTACNGCDSAECTWDPSCGGNSCDLTCRGYATWDPYRGECVICG